MIGYAVWTWYDRLLNSSDLEFPWRESIPELQLPVPTPLTTIKTLLANGAIVYSKGDSPFSLLYGLIFNIIQFDGEERPQEVVRSCMSTWLELVQELGYDLKDYLRTEAIYLDGRCYYMGSGIKMIVCFNEDTAPHIRTIFQGPQEESRTFLWIASPNAQIGNIGSSVMPSRNHHIGQKSISSGSSQQKLSWLRSDAARLR
jgi:hypothetical protein